MDQTNPSETIESDYDGDSSLCELPGSQIKLSVKVPSTDLVEQHNQWYQRRLQTIELVCKLKEEAEIRSKHVQRAKLAGSVLGIAGAALLVAGVGMAIFTMGAGVVVANFGIVSSVAGGATSGVAEATHWKENKAAWRHLANELEQIRAGTAALLDILPMQDILLEDIQTENGKENISAEQLRAKIEQMCEDPTQDTVQATTWGDFILTQPSRSLTKNEAPHDFTQLPQQLFAGAAHVARVATIGGAVGFSVLSVPLDSFTIYQQFKKLKDGKSNAVDLLANLQCNLMLGNY